VEFPEEKAKVHVLAYGIIYPFLLQDKVPQDKTLYILYRRL
jgi:hypothetical protein